MQQQKMLNLRKFFDLEHWDQHQIIDIANKEDICGIRLPVAACGGLFFRINNNELELLLISYSHEKYQDLQDIGGKTELFDKTLVDTLTREMHEESNGIISENYIKSRVDAHKYQTFYCNYSKYLIFTFFVDNNFHNNPNVFGSKENIFGFERTINWHKYTDVQHKLAIRLQKCTQLTIYFNEILNNLHPNNKIKIEESEHENKTNNENNKVREEKTRKLAKCFIESIINRNKITNIKTNKQYNKQTKGHTHAKKSKKYTNPNDNIFDAK